jgi:hypothetical protein
MEISKDINDYIPELIKILNIRNDWLSLKELQTKNLVINNEIYFKGTPKLIHFYPKFHLVTPNENLPQN